MIHTKQPPSKNYKRPGVSLVLFAEGSTSSQSGDTPAITGDTRYSLSLDCCMSVLSVTIFTITLSNMRNVIPSTFRHGTESSNATERVASPVLASKKTLPSRPYFGMSTCRALRRTNSTNPSSTQPRSLKNSCVCRLTEALWAYCAILWR